MTRTHSPVRARTRALPTVLLAGAAVGIVGAGEALAINDARRFIDWNEWASVGVTGEGVVIGNIDGGQPLADHTAFSDRVLLQFSWPFDNTGTLDGIVGGTRNWDFTHATAVASTMISQGTITGIAPDASLISASFASGINPVDGFFTDVTNEAVAFPMFTLADSGLADDVAGALGLPQIPTASVINLSFGSVSGLGRRSEDPTSLIANAVASMFDTTIVAAAGNEAQNPFLEPENLPSEMDEGTTDTPAAAFNTISVGYLNADFDDVNNNSSGGLLPVFEYFVAANLEDMDEEPNPNFPPPSELEMFQARVGVDIVAPGTLLRLAASPVEPFESPGAGSFSDQWAGSSFASGIVAGSAALVHQYGNENDLWVLGRPSGLVTRAVLLNSAAKDPVVDFNNSAMFGDTPGTEDVWTTTQGLDEEVGAGALDLERLFNQFALADTKDVTDLTGFRIDNNGATTIPTMSGTDPNIAFTTVLGSPPPDPFAGAFPQDQNEFDEHRPGEIMIADRRRMSRKALDSSFLSLEPRIAEELKTLRPLQFGDNPDLGGGVVPPPFGGGTTPGPGFDGRLPDNGRQIEPPDIPGAPGSDRFRTGWDHGNLGFGFIDIPIGMITRDSAVTVTLVWNRTETWNVPNFAGPLNLISPSLVVPPQFLDGLQDGLQPAAQQQAIERPERREVDVESNPRPPRGGIQSIRQQYSAFWPEVGCGLTGHRGHHPAPRQGGELALRDMGPEQVRERLKETFDNLAERMDDTWSYKRLAQQLGEGVQVEPRGAGGAEIELLFDSSIPADSGFAIASRTAADIWESLLEDPVTIRIQVGLVNDPGGFLAATSRSIVGLNYDPLRDAMIADASSEESALLNRLPVEDSAFPMTFRFGNGVILNSEDLGMIELSRANAKALGITVPPVPDLGDIDTQIVINEAFPWDFDRSDGISSDAFDLTFAMLHEFGHTLGFISGTDTVDRGFDPTATTLDFFRFPSVGIGVPNTPINFERFIRDLAPGADTSFDVDINDGGMPLVPEIDDTFRMSTGVNNGDGRQASHWKDDQLTGLFIGLMDPTAGPPGTFIPDPITRADLLAFSLIGWDTDFLAVEPPADDPSEVPRIFFESFGGDSPLSDPEPRFEFEMENVDLELWRFRGGDGNDLIATSESVEANVEHIFVDGDAGTGRVPLGNYFIRINFNATRVDFGGYEVNPGVDSVPVPGYNNLLPGAVQYGLAWYIDLALEQGDLIEPSAEPADLSGDGVVDSTDLSLLLSDFGANNPSSDLDGDGEIGSKDLAIMLGRFNRD